MIYLKKIITFLLQLEETNDFLSIHNGGSDDSEIVAKLAGQMYDAEISIPGNQMFVVFQTNEQIVHKGFHALIIESKYFYQQSYPNLEITYQLRNCINFNFKMIIASIGLIKQMEYLDHQILVLMIN